MGEILTDLSPAAVVPAIEANLSELGLVYGASRYAELRVEAGVLSLLTRIPHPAFNGVLHARLTPEEADSRIDETLAWFRSQGAPMMWVTGPSSEPRDLGVRLLAHGLIQEDRPGVGAEDLGMAVDLNALTEPAPAPTGLTIERVAEEDRRRQWVEAAGRGFEVAPEVTTGLSSLLAGLPLQGRMSHFVGLQEGAAVGTASLLLGGGVGGIYNVSTVPERRRLGIGTAMVRAALKAACGMGCRVAILMAAPMGVGVYRRIGFREYCTFNVYLELGTGEAQDAAG